MLLPLATSGAVAAPVALAGSSDAAAAGSASAGNTGSATAGYVISSALGLAVSVAFWGTVYNTLVGRGTINGQKLPYFPAL